MEILVNDQPVFLPDRLADIFLKDVILFHQDVVAGLEERALEIQQMKEDKTLAALDLQYSTMMETFSYWTQIPIDSFDHDPALVDVVACIYNNSVLPKLFAKDLDEEPRNSFTWRDEIWTLPKIELEHGDPEQFGELIDAKQLVSDMSRNKAGRWQMMQYLSAIFLRKEGEVYQESFLYPGSERLLLMEDLPMDIAAQVGFFLSSIMSTSPRLFLSLLNLERSREGSIALDILLSGDGLTFSSPSLKLKSLTFPIAGKIQ